jgi:raffinose/stachyose/melibiose transport system permease protein
MFKTTSKMLTVFCQVLLTLLGIVFALPLVVMFVVSLQGRGLGNYQLALAVPNIIRFFLNSIFVTACTIVLVYATASIAAYAFSKLKIPGKEFFFNTILVGLMIPGISVTVPLFILFRNTHVLNTYAAMILPFTAFSLPFTVLMMRNYFDGIPTELLDAAMIDGCNSLNALWWIILPMSKAISIVVVIWTFLGSWNDYFTALVYIRSDEMLPVTHLPNFLVRLQGVAAPDIGPVFATLVLISLPVIVTYILLQRYFEDGIVSGALK